MTKQLVFIIITTLSIASEIFGQSTWTFYNSSNCGISGNYIKTLGVDNQNNLWIGTGNNGLSKFNGTNWINYSTTNSGIAADVIYSLLVDNENNIWIGTGYKGLSKFNGTTWTTYDVSNSGIANNQINSLAIDQNKNIWIGTENGLSKFDGINWTTYNVSNSSIADNRVSSIKIDSQGNIWIGTHNGLSKFNGTNWITYNKSNCSIAANSISSLLIDFIGNIWVGVYDDPSLDINGNGKGLCMFDNSNWTTYNTSNSEIVGNNITNLAVDNQNNLWVLCGNTSLSKYNGISWNNTYNPYPNSISYQVAAISLIADKLDNIWLGTDVGLFKMNLTCTNPIANITPQGNTTFCQGGSVNLNASTGTNYTYQWYNNGNIINNATSSVYNATTSGDYSVKVSDGGCNATSSAISIVVNPIPNNEIILSGNNTFCQGSSVNLSAKGAGTYLWSNGSINQSITATQTGSYSVTVTSNGCNSTSSLTQITVNPLPTATITPQTSTTFCQGGTVVLNASIETGYSYEWYKTGTIINGSTTSSYTVNQSGSYTVKVINGTCNATSTATVVTVNTNPTVTLNSLNPFSLKTSLPVQLVGNPSGGTYSGEGVFGSIFTPANTSLGKKTIIYNYSTQQGCSGSASQTTIVVDSVGNVCSTYDTLKIKVHFTLGLYANTSNTINFYPNPTKDVLFIDNGNYQAMSGYSIKIVSLAGAVVYNQAITSQQVQISMNQFATKGLYIAQILDSNNTIVDSKKIVLE